MKFWNTSLALIAIALIGSMSASAQDQQAGVVRISDLPASGEQMKAEASQVGMYREVKAESCNTEKTNCSKQICDSSSGCRHCMKSPGLFPFLFTKRCPDCEEEYCYYDKNGKLVCEKNNNCNRNRCRRPVPYNTSPFGQYRMAYPLDINYFDQRDGGLYAAQGYGVNVTVPLAPVVGAQYNYGWGVPSSRLSYLGNRIPLPSPYPPGFEQRVPRFAPIGVK